MSDLNFDRTVIFVLEHNSDGAIGVVLNRPSDVPVFEAVPTWAGLAAQPPVVFMGGPVSMGAVLAVGRAKHIGPEEDITMVIGDIGVVDVSRPPEDLDAEIGDLRLFSGYSGWSAGQLEGEIESGAWLSVEAVFSDPFDEAPSDLWTRALRRKSGMEAMTKQGRRAGWLN